MPKNNKRFALISVIIIPIFYFVVFTANNWILGMMPVILMVFLEYITVHW